MKLVLQYARGGFGSVFLCENKLDGREYAVKKVRLSSNVEKNEKILREARILAKLYNKRIVRYYQAWTEVDFLSKKKEPEPDENGIGSGGSFSDEIFNGADSSNGGEVTYMYIQMEYCPRTLRGHLDSVDAPAEKEFASHVIRQVAEGLRYLHKQGIIHRDLTPSNIFFNNEKNIKIGDFGLAKFFKAEQVVSGCSSSITAGCEISSGGASAYTAPEIGAILYSAPEIDAGDS